MNKKKITENLCVCRTDKTLVPKGKNSTRILEMTVTAPMIDSVNAKPKLNLSLVIDRSGSMSGDKLHFAKQAASHLIDLLGEEDLVSVVIYDDVVKTVSTPRNMTEPNKTKAKGEIQGIFSRGSTALFDGWLKGCEQAALNTQDGIISRTLLLSDGLANVGLTSQDEIASHARALFQRDVSTSCFGIGRDYNEHLLEAMSNAGGGNFHFLEALGAIPMAFEREFEELINASLRNAKISLELPQSVEVEVSGGWPAVKNGQVLDTSLGTLYAGREQRVYFQLHIGKMEGKKDLIIPVSFQAETLDGQAVLIGQEIKFKLTSPEEEKDLKPDAELVERFALIDMADRATEALRMARAGDRAGASDLLFQRMDKYQANISTSTRSKYTNLSNSINEGMDELTFKRRHQEEYYNKRARFDSRDYSLRLVNGHLFTGIENQSVLIDTGIPVSLSRDPEWYFMQEVHPMSEGYLGVTLGQISGLVGAPVDVLLGSDILKNYCLTFDLDQRHLSISTQPLMRSRHNFPLSLLMGVPGLRVDIQGQPVEMFLDTGAKLSYVSQELVNGLNASGREKDFYPGLGEFETDVYMIDFSLGDLVFTLRCGVLPAMLETALNVSGKRGIIGTEFFEQYGIQLDFPRSILSIRA